MIVAGSEAASVLRIQCLCEVVAGTQETHLNSLDAGLEVSLISQIVSAGGMPAYLSDVCSVRVHHSFRASPAAVVACFISRMPVCMCCLL